MVYSQFFQFIIHFLWSLISLWVLSLISASEPLQTRISKRLGSPLTSYNKIFTLKTLTIPVRIGVPLPKSRDNMVPRTPDVCVITEILDHTALADARDVLNPEPSVWLYKKMKAWVLAPSKVWHSPEKVKRKSFIKCNDFIKSKSKEPKEFYFDDDIWYVDINRLQIFVISLFNIDPQN